MKTVLARDPRIMAKWLQMFNRYNRNCETGYSDPLTVGGVEN